MSKIHHSLLFVKSQIEMAVEVADYSARLCETEADDGPDYDLIFRKLQRSVQLLNISLRQVKRLRRTSFKSKLTV